MPTERLNTAGPVAADSASAWQIVVLTAQGAEAHRLPATGNVIIGRGEDAAIRIDDASVSRHHARVHLGPPLTIEDLESANGTRVKDRAVALGERVALRGGEFVQVGRALLVLQSIGREEPSAPIDGRALVADPAMQQLHRLAARVAQGDISVLLLGETGVGKEVMAETIHAASPRRGKPFLRLNCSSLSETLLESELFGHEKGAFTGAVATRIGLLENANGGTVFLDEVGELSPGLQARLLRVIEDRLVRRVGGSSEHKADVRFIAATNRDLASEVERGTFRRDLFYRLSAATLVIPPLRERRGEIVPLAQRFLVEECKRLGRGSATLTSDAIAWLERHDWPGNIRELRNAIQRAVLLTSGSVIAAEHLRGGAPSATASSRPAEPRDSDRTAERVDAGLPASGGLQGAVAQAERAQIIAALEATGWNQSAAARRLGIGRRTLIDKMIKLSIPRGRKT